MRASSADDVRYAAPVIEAHLGRPGAAEAGSNTFAHADRRSPTRSDTIPGARAVLQAVTALGLPWRIASNSGHEEMAAKFARTGLTALVAGPHAQRATTCARAASPHPTSSSPPRRPKASARSLLVIEDSLPGAAARWPPAWPASASTGTETARRCARRVRILGAVRVAGAVSAAMRIAA